VVHFMSPAQGSYISIVAAGKPFKSLVDDDFMHQEVGKAIQGKSGADGDHPIHFIYNSQHDKQPAWYGEDEEESIILFKETRAFLVMVFVQVPTKSMHYIPVKAPGKTFH